MKSFQRQWRKGFALVGLLGVACVPVTGERRPPELSTGITVEKLQRTTADTAGTQILKLFLQPETLTLTPHEPYKIKLLATLADGRIVEIVNHSKMSCKVEDPAIASCLGNTVKAESIGETQLIATVANRSARLSLRVKAAEATSVENRVRAVRALADRQILAVGQTLTLEVFAELSDGRQNRELLYTTDRGDRIQIDEVTGQLTRLAPGEATVTVYSRRDARQFQRFVLLDPPLVPEASPAPVATPIPTPRPLETPRPELWVSQTSYVLAPGESAQLRAELRLSDGSRSQALDYTLEPADLFDWNPETGVLRRLKPGLAKMMVRARDYALQERILVGDRAATNPAVSPTPSPIPSPTGVPSTQPTIQPTATATPLPPATPVPSATPTLVPGSKISNTLGMEFVLLAAGTFLMGSSESEAGGMGQETQHQVTLTQPYFLQTTEVTQAQWQAIMGSNPSYRKAEQRPVEQVSWTDIQTFIQLLNQRGEGLYRLPTEAEWEYAARAGTTTPWFCGDSWACLPEVAWFSGNAEGQTHPVAQKQANAWGLYDMHGNVWEWVQDWYDGYPNQAVINPQGPSSGAHRVFRGGGCYNHGGGIRSAIRGNDSPGIRYDYLGFRLVRLQ
jgi:formylglycine-generating enzyme required for sulfatase activity